MTGLPTYSWRCAPPGLATRRQLRAAGLRPGRQPVAGQVVYRRWGRTRYAYLYRTDLARPKKPATRGQLAAVQAALRARRVCRSCGGEKPYTIPVSLGECLDCADAAVAR